MHLSLVNKVVLYCIVQRTREDAPPDSTHMSTGFPQVSTDGKQGPAPLAYFKPPFFFRTQNITETGSVCEQVSYRLSSLTNLIVIKQAKPKQQQQQINRERESLIFCQISQISQLTDSDCLHLPLCFSVYLSSFLVRHPRKITILLLTTESKHIIMYQKELFSPLNA